MNINPEFFDISKKLKEEVEGRIANKINKEIIIASHPVNLEELIK